MLDELLLELLELRLELELELELLLELLLDDDEEETLAMDISITIFPCVCSRLMTPEVLV
jgi:hypothetical protein